MIYDLIRDYGEFVRIWLGPELNIIVSKPEDVEVSCFYFYLHKLKRKIKKKIVRFHFPKQKQTQRC